MFTQLYPQSMQYATTSLPSTNGLRLLWLLSLLLAFFYNIGAFPLFDLDEGAFSQATREMFLRDNFLTTYLNGEPRYDKPILIYWLQALSIKILGSSELAFRLPSAVAATLWSIAVVAFTWSISTPRNAFISGILMAGAAGVGIIGKAATADALLNFCLTGTMFTLYLHFTKRSLEYLVAAAVFAGVGFMTKGPIALIIPAMVSLIYSLWSGRFKQWLQLVTNPLAWLTFLLVGMPWYIVHYFKEGPVFLENFIGQHNLGRFASEMEGHGGAWWYYLPAILLVAFPFGFLILHACYRLKSISETEAGRFLLSWFFFVLVFFSFSATKLPHYILYGLTPLFVLTSLQLHEKQGLKSVFIPLFLFIITLIALPGFLQYLIPSIKDPLLSIALTNTTNSFNSNYFLILTLALGISIWLFMTKRWPQQGRLLSAGLISIFVISEFLLPLVAEIQQEAIKQAGQIAAKHDKPAVIWRLNTPSFSVYSGKITPRRKPGPGELVLTKAHYLDELQNHEMLFEKNGIALALINRKEINHVSSISALDEPSLHAASTPDIAIGSVVDLPAESEPSMVPVDQLQGNDIDRTGTVGGVDHTRGRTGGKRNPVTTAQNQSENSHHSLDLMYSSGALGTSTESRIRSTKATPDSRPGGNHHNRSWAQVWEFSFRPHLYPVRPSWMYGHMDEFHPATAPLPYPVFPSFAGGAFENCCRSTLAARHYGRHGGRLDIGNGRKQPLPHFSHRRYLTDLGWTSAITLHPLSPSCLRHRVCKCKGSAAWYSPVCAWIGLPGKPEINKTYFASKRQMKPGRDL
ncbi:MAG: glycosyl transferase family 39 [gamma proteobacterium symbiont of Ctena orbiculata]|nr:MAG: glycosyl transferase family 39 [gamma proteobacterium symbiont of Ctena orbiculata]